MGRKGIVVALVGLNVLLAASSDAQTLPDAQQAQEALQRAEQAVQRAREQRSLWTTAQAALEQARSAAVRGDYAEAVRAARFATEQAELGVAQRAYPRLDR
jgi:hypothetical protein